MAFNLFLPVGPMLLGDDIVAASDASRGLAVDGVRFCRASKACAVLLAVDTESPVTNAQRKTGLDEELCEAAQVLLHLQAAKMRAFCHDVGARSANTRRCAEHLFPCGDRLFEDVLLNLFLERVVVADIAFVGHPPVAMTEVLSERK